MTTHYINSLHQHPALSPTKTILGKLHENARPAHDIATSLLAMFEISPVIRLLCGQQGCILY